MVGLCCKATFSSGLPQARAAVEFAERKHLGQRRFDGTPFGLHPMEVASLLYETGAPDYVIAAGMLHDVVEKTEVAPAAIRERFGHQITNLVLAVSDDDQIEAYAARKAALRQKVTAAGEEALSLFAADKISKLRELRRETAADKDNDQTPARTRKRRARRLRHYQRSLAMLEERLPQSPLVNQLREELAIYCETGLLTHR